MTATQPKSSDRQSLIFGVYDRLYDQGHVCPDVVLAPADADGKPDWDKTDPANVEALPAGEWPEDAATAARACVIVSNIDGCDAATSMIVSLHEDGDPSIVQIHGPKEDADVAALLIARDIGARPPERAPSRLSESLARLAADLAKSKPVNDNKPQLDARLQPFAEAYGGEIRGRTLFGATVDGTRCQIAFAGSGEAWMYAATGGRPITLPATEESAFPGILSSEAFVGGFSPPDYLVDGIVQSGFLYSITGQTGSGKTAVALLLAACIASGEPFAGHEVKAGRVLYFAGENPDDVRMRWIGLCHQTGIDPKDMDVHFVEGVFSITDFAERIQKDVAALGGVAAIFVDTTAAYFPGTDENSNVEMGRYARLLRSLSRNEGRPAVIAASHPIKNAAGDNLLPRGGGAFLNEVDGNLSLAKKAERTAELHWQGKFRGPDFKSITFDLPEVRVPALVDSRGREIPTVMAAAVGEAEIAARVYAANRDDRGMLLQIRAGGNRSLRELAEAAGFGTDDGAKRKAQTVTDRLKRSQFVTYELGTWKLTKKGEEAATAAVQAIHQEDAGARLAKRVSESAKRKHTGNKRTAVR